MSAAAAISFAIAWCCSSVEGFIAPTAHPARQLRPSLPPSASAHHHHQQQQQRKEVALKAAPDGLHWFVKTEQFCKPFPEVKPYLEAHREWVRSVREESDDDNTQQTLVSGYRVDENDRPGGGGLMIFAAKDYEAAEKFVRNDPLVANECVDWQLNKWIAETGDISIE